jgi:hypothetical protein
MQQSELAVNLISGVTNVTTAGQRVALAASRTPIRWIVIHAKSGNGNVIYVGDDSVTSANGFILAANQFTPRLPIDDLSKIYLDAAVNGEGVTWLAGKG